jgi:spore maturation protein CgeB
VTAPLDIVVVGLALSSSWGNGHATTWRALLRGLAAEGHSVLFLERDVPWYAATRDLTDPDFCRLAFYDDVPGLIRDHGPRMMQSDAVIVGSYVPEGVQVIDALAALGLPCLCFYDIDTPVTMALLDEGRNEFLAARQVPLFDIYFSFSGGRVLDHLMQERGAKDARALYCAVDPARYHPLPDAVPRWDLGYLGTYSPDRQPTLEALLIEPARRLPDRRFVVAGPGYPDGIDWPANVDRIDHIGPADHARFYSEQRFTLNVTRAAMRQMGWSPSVRLFEAAACGTAIISDNWPGLSDLFPAGEAILIAKNTDDVITALAGMREPDRRRIGAAARERVLACHTGQSRAQELATAIADIIGRTAKGDLRRAAQG